jgi:hypothetical protein
MDLMTKLKKLTLQQFHRYPLMEAMDFHKLIFQSTMGPAHSLASIENAKKWFLEEWAQTPPLQDVPMIEDISCSTPIFRVHFAPCKAQCIPPERLLNCFIESSASFLENSAMYQECIEAFAEITKHPPFAQFHTDFQEIKNGIQQKKAGIPRHSAAFRTVYQPHYRIVSGHYLPAITPHI